MAWGVPSLPRLHYPDLKLNSILQNEISLFQKQDFQVIFFNTNLT